MMKLLTVMLVFVTLEVSCTTLNETIVVQSNPPQEPGEVGKNCVEKQLEMCQRRETDLANTVVTSLRRESDVKVQLQSCEDREKLLNFKLQQHQEANVNQIKEVSGNLSDCLEENQQSKTQGEKMEEEKNKLQESLNQCTQSLQQLTEGQELILRHLRRSENDQIVELINSKPKASLSMVQLDTGAYLFPNKRLNWTSARDFCRFNGMNLVSIETAEENSAIYNYAKNLPGWYEYAWTSGCYVKIHGDKYTWLGTGSPVSYFNWAGGEPSDRGRDGFCILLSNRSPAWYDGDFNGVLRFVCEL